jgi:hypothetical protein
LPFFGPCRPLQRVAIGELPFPNGLARPFCFALEREFSLSRWHNTKAVFVCKKNLQKSFHRGDGEPQPRWPTTSPPQSKADCFLIWPRLPERLAARALLASGAALNERPKPKSRQAKEGRKMASELGKGDRKGTANFYCINFENSNF